MAQSFLKLLISFLLVGLMIYGLISFGYKIQSENSASESILEHTLLNTTFIGLSRNLSSQGDTSESQREAFEEQTTSTSVGFFMLDTNISVGKIFTTMLVLVYNLTINSKLIT